MERLAALELSGPAWWRARRLQYNAGLVVAGLAALACYAGVAWIAPASAAAPDLTLDSIGSEAVGYLLAMGVANLFYGLGPLSERIFPSRDHTRFRRRAYAVGFVLSCALPFGIPLAAGLKLLSGR